MKKTIATIVMSSVFSVTVGATVAFAGAQTPNDPKAQLTPEQQQFVDAKLKTATEYRKQKDAKDLAEIKKNVSNSGVIKPRSSSTTNKFLSVNPRVENPNDNCGPAATLQIANYKWSGNPYYQSAEDHPGVANQYNLRYLEKTDSSGTYIVNIPGPLNTASNTGSFYVAANMSTQDNLTSAIINDVDKNYPIIADVNTGNLDYYNGISLTHYITVDGYTSEIYNNVVISHNNAHSVDDNWNNTYYGWHWTTMSGLYSSVHYFGTNANIVW